MADTLVVGRTHEITRQVTPELSADQLGNPGCDVFATPALISLLEETAIQCVASTLSAGQATVGTRVDVQHLAATPVGMTVTARADLIEVDGRRLVFKVEARDEVEPIATGTHERFILNSLARFLARAKAKGNPTTDL